MGSSNRYILVGHESKPEPDLLKWARYMESADRRVASTETAVHWVSTVFLGLDHRLGDGPPLLFETMAFALGSSYDVGCERSGTWGEALEAHARMVDKMRKLEELPEGE